MCKSGNPSDSPPRRKHKVLRRLGVPGFLVGGGVTGWAAYSVLTTGAHGFWSLAGFVFTLVIAVIAAVGFIGDISPEDSAPSVGQINSMMGSGT